jgi:acetyl esterase/lipase
MLPRWPGLFVAGHSAGAYNAVMLALAPEILAGVGLGPSDITAVAGLSGPYDFLPLDARSTRAAFGEADDLEATQPINRPVAGAPPMLLVTGDADTLVEPRNTMALSRHLRSGGRRVETIVYPGVDHAGTLLAISRPMRDRAPVIADIDRFFKRYQ